MKRWLPLLVLVLGCDSVPAVSAKLGAGAIREVKIPDAGVTCWVVERIETSSISCVRDSERPQ